MIDRKARNHLAELIRALCAGIVTNDEFEGALRESQDDGVLQVFHHGAWCLYCDMKEYKLKDKDALSVDDRSIIARWILFLKSDYEYTWPSASFRDQVLNFISFGTLGQSTLDRWEERGNVSCWPFTSCAQFNEAKLGKGYLGAGINQ